MTQFKTGDSVRVVRGVGNLTTGKTFIVDRASPDYLYVKGMSGGFFYDRFVLATAPVGTLKPQLQALLNVLQTAGQPLSAETIATRANMVVGTNVAGRIRDLRTAKYGSHKIETVRDGKATLYKLAA